MLKLVAFNLLAIILRDTMEQILLTGLLLLALVQGNVSYYNY